MSEMPPKAPSKAPRKPPRAEAQTKLQSTTSGFSHLGGYLETAAQTRLWLEISDILEQAPLYTPVMPRSGKPLSVRMTNCGPLGWYTDKADGYRYIEKHPATGRAWPAIPDQLIDLWQSVSNCSALPEACLINWYEPGARMGLHRDQDEQAFDAPVVSVSLGDNAWFRVGGTRRKDPADRFLLRSGDVVILAGNARLAYHGIDRILAKTSDLLPWPGRINLTLRRVTPL